MYLKKEMVNTSQVKYVVNATVTANYEYEFHFLNHLLTNRWFKKCETVHLHETMRMHCFVSAYLLCFVLQRLYHTVA